MVKRLVFLGFGALFMAVGSMGCDEDLSGSRRVKHVKIGVIYPLSGENAATGEDLRAGAELSAAMINGSFPLDFPLAREEGLPSHDYATIQIVFRNSESDPQKAADQVEELVNDEHVVAVMGCYSSTVTAAASERAEMMQVPFLNATSTSPVLTERGFRWFFRTTPNDHIFAENFFAFLGELSQRPENEVPKRIILVYENRVWGTGVAREERSLAMMQDYIIAAEIPYDSLAQDFTEQAIRIKRNLPGVILQASYASDAVRLIRAYKAQNVCPAAVLGMNAGFISPQFLDNLGADAEYIFSRDVWARDLGMRNLLIRRVNDIFAERYGRDMTGNSARSFTGLNTLVQAIDRARSLEPEAVRRALEETYIEKEKLIMPWEGISFDSETGQNVLGRGLIVQVQGGEYVTVWPSNIASAAPIWPAPGWSKRAKTEENAKKTAF